MTNSHLVERLISWLIERAGASDRVDVPEQDVISHIEDELDLNRVDAVIEWERICEDVRKQKIVRDGYLIQWQMFRSAFQVTRFPTVEEIQSTAEIYAGSTDTVLMNRIRNLTGLEFERFIATVLSHSAEYRNITVTPASRDGGVDFRGAYAPSEQLKAPLMGQAKQVTHPVGASVAREFIGALETANERRVFGLIVSTAGFTDPAIATLDGSRFHILHWGMDELLKVSRGIATRLVDIRFEVPDQSFWDEIVGGS